MDWSHALTWSSVRTRGLRRRAHRLERCSSGRPKLLAGEQPVLGLALLVVGVGDGEEPPRERLVRPGVDEILELVGQPGQQRRARPGSAQG